MKSYIASHFFHQNGSDAGTAFIEAVDGVETVSGCSVGRYRLLGVIVPMEMRHQALDIAISYFPESN